MSGINSKRPNMNQSNINLINTNTTSETNSITIQDLPDELMLAIFDNIPSEQLVLTIPLVCQRWSDLHDDARLYKHLEFKDNVPDTTVAVKLLKMAPRLKSLKMVSRTDSNEILRHVGFCNPLLETLKLRKCVGSLVNRFKLSETCLRSIIEYCPKLRRLSLRETSCQSRKFYNTIGHHLPLLQAVDFGSSRYCYQDDLYDNADKFQELSDLRIFSHFSDDVVTRFCAKHSSFLTTVKLQFEGCTDASLTTLATCRQLRTLYLDTAENVTDMGIMEISKLPNLEKLYMSVIDEVTSQCWISFFETPYMKQIKKLTLKNCLNVKYDVIIHIAQNLSDIRSLSLELWEKIGFDCHLNIRRMLSQHCHYKPSNDV